MSWGNEFKKLYNTPEMVRGNMQKVYSQSTEEDLMYGKGWYERANLFCLALSEQYKVDEMKVAGVLSVISRWQI